VSNVPVKEVRNDPFDESRVLFFSPMYFSSRLYITRIYIYYTHRTAIYIHALYTTNYVLYTG